MNAQHVRIIAAALGMAVRDLFRQAHTKWNSEPDYHTADVICAEVLNGQQKCPEWVINYAIEEGGFHGRN